MPPSWRSVQVPLTAKGENEEDAWLRDVFAGGPKVPESFGQAALVQHSPAFSGLSDRRP
jgi:hypothetical protein